VTQLIGRERPLTPRHATFATITAGAVRDRVVVTAFPQPASYTGDDVVEIGAHGSAVVLNQILTSAVATGARLAAPGEFTLRAYINGKIDLPQAEAVADLIDAVTPLQARAAFDQLNGTLTSAVAEIEAALFDLIARLEASVDFPDEGYHFVEPPAVAGSIGRITAMVDQLLASAGRGRLVREGLQVAIIGLPNAGKSSLFNALVGAHRAIVTPIPGTTRDVLTEVVNLRGLRVTLIDTAGISESKDPVEREGVKRARQALDVSDLILLVCDGSTSDGLRAGLASLSPGPDGRNVTQTLETKTLIVSSKSDITPAWTDDRTIQVSAVTGHGLDDLIARIHQSVGGDSLQDIPAVSNVRHIDLLRRAREALAEAIGAVEKDGGALSEEFVLVDLQRAREYLEEVTGVRTSDDLLAHVFLRFCVGK
jgi:tRNA modification GTPase